MTAQTMIGFMLSNNEKGLNPMGWLQKLLGKYKTKEVSPFATDEEYISHGFDQIMCGVDMPWDVRQFIYDNFITIFQAGDPRGCKKLFIDALNGVEWSWEWYDQSEATFNDFGVYPYMWQREDDKNKKIKLLCHSVSKAIYSCRDKNKNINLLKRKGLSWGDAELSDLIRLSATGEPEKIEQLTRTMFEDGFDNGAGQWPPYYPGDRSSIMREKYFHRYRKKTS